MPGVSRSIKAITTWDPDGPGPQPELLVIGGNFTFAGNIAASNIAAWDRTKWFSLGSGTDGDINALTVHDNQLIAGGFFATTGDNASAHRARWGVLVTADDGDVDLVDFSLLQRCYSGPGHPANPACAD